MKVLIIGLGYVGLRVAKFYQAQGADIFATTTNVHRLNDIISLKIHPLLISPSDLSSVSHHFFSSDLILISVAPKDHASYEETYLKSAQNIQNLINNHSATAHIIYLSSTSIYGEHKGDWVYENSKSLFPTPQAEILLETEKVYQSLKNSSILRLAEIYGPGRDFLSKVKYWENREFPGSGESYTNTIHAKDIVLAIDHLFMNALFDIYNLACDEHPVRKELYKQVSKKYALKPIKWGENVGSSHKGNKKVSNQKIKEAGFKFCYPLIVV